jgi:hypothetical protein
MAYVKPQVLVFQEFTIVPAEITGPLRAHISGPNAVLHRYSDSSEKSGSRLGAYNPDLETTYLYPQRRPGSVVDSDYVKLFADNALLQYFRHESTDPAIEIKSVENKKNQIVAEGIAGATPYQFKTNGSYPHTPSAFADRGVKIGDVVQLRGAKEIEEDGEVVECEELSLTTTVAGFIANPSNAEIKTATADASNAGNSLNSPALGDVEQIGAPFNALELLVDVSEYSAIYDGVVTETYTVEVIKSSLYNCDATKLRIRSASGLDDVAEVAAGAVGAGQIAAGSRGLKLSFVDTNDPLLGDAEFVVGQKWTFTVTQNFKKVIALSNPSGNYTGEYSDTYIIECTKGGLISGDSAGSPEITVRTVRGKDYGVPVRITESGAGSGAEFNVGNYGVTVRFVDSSNGGIPALNKGDKWYIEVVAAAAGPINTLILRDDLSADMRDLTSLDVTLFIKDDIQISKNRLSEQSGVNYELEDTQIVVKEGCTAYHPEWTKLGVPQSMPIKSGDLYLEYREWVADLTDSVNAISTTAELDAIPGPLDPDNPLKWGVFKALANSNGTLVKYTAVANPASLDSWVQVLERVKGRDDIYNLVPLTFNRQVQDLYAAHIDGESNEIANNWKAGFMALQSRSSKLVVGEGATVGGVAGTDTGLVLATVTDAEASGQQYTLLSVPAGGGNFITNNVRPGDIVRHSYAIDGFGAESYAEAVVDTVLSEDSLLLYASLNAPVNQAQKIEIWHSLTRNEIADDVAEQAGSFGNRRICAVWPDQVGSGGVLQPGYFLAAALAGLVSGVAPQQALTNVEVAGFDDYSRSYKLFNETQLNRMAEAGVWIVTEDRDGTPHTRHALTTNNLDLNSREEMIRRNVDSISYLFLARMRPFIGRTNVSEGMLLTLNAETRSAIDFLTNFSVVPQLGGQLTSAEILVLRVHPLLKDRIELALDLVVPAPLNNIEIRLVV